MLAGKQKEIHEARDRKLETAREARLEIRAQQAAATDAKGAYRRLQIVAQFERNPLPRNSLRRFQ